MKPAPGLIVAGVIVVRWAADDFGALAQTDLAIAAVTLMVIGLQIVFLLPALHHRTAARQTR